MQVEILIHYLQNSHLYCELQDLPGGGCAVDASCGITTPGAGRDTDTLPAK